MNSSHSVHVRNVNADLKIFFNMVPTQWKIGMFCIRSGAPPIAILLGNRFRRRCLDQPGPPKLQRPLKMIGLVDTNKLT